MAEERHHGQSNYLVVTAINPCFDTRLPVPSLDQPLGRRGRDPFVTDTSELIPNLSSAASCVRCCQCSSQTMDGQKKRRILIRWNNVWHQLPTLERIQFGLHFQFPLSPPLSPRTAETPATATLRLHPMATALVPSPSSCAWPTNDFVSLLLLPR